MSFETFVFRSTPVFKRFNFCLINTDGGALVVQSWTVSLLKIHRSSHLISTETITWNWFKWLKNVSWVSVRKQIKCNTHFFQIFRNKFSLRTRAFDISGTKSDTVRIIILLCVRNLGAVFTQAWGTSGTNQLSIPDTKFRRTTTEKLLMTLIKLCHWLLLASTREKENL